MTSAAGKAVGPLRVENNPGVDKPTRVALAEIQNNDDLKTIPVVVLTTSRTDADIMASGNLYTNRYLRGE
jgi:hypothetical protein